MHVLVHRHPAVAFGIGPGAIELAGGIRQGHHEGIDLAWGHQGTSSARGLDGWRDHHKEGTQKGILAQAADWVHLRKAQAA